MNHRNILSLSDIPPELHQWFKDEAVRRTKQSGTRVTMYRVIVEALYDYRKDMSEGKVENPPHESQEPKGDSPMSKKKSESVRREVIRQYFTGLSYDDISHTLQIGKGTVFAIIQELRDGKTPGYKDLPELVEDIRQLAVSVHSQKAGKSPERPEISTYKPHKPAKTILNKLRRIFSKTKPNDVTMPDPPFQGLEVWSFRWRGKSYNALGKWEKNWVKWAMKHSPKSLDTFIKNESKDSV